MAPFKSAPFKVAVVVGSARRESFNRKLAQALAGLGGNRFEFRFARIDDLPLYNQDLEDDFPASVSRFKGEIEAADGVLFVTPEHSRSIPAVLKNALDWGARPWGKNSWEGRVAAITGASPGAIGTAVAQQHLRQVLGNLGVLVMPGEAYISVKPDTFAADGSVADANVRGFLKDFVDRFAVLLERFAAPVRAAA